MRLTRQGRIRSLFAALIVTVGATGTAIAQPTDRSSTPPQAGRNESKTPLLGITPFVAMGDDFAAGAGGAFTFAWTRRFSVEAEVSLGRDAARSSLSLLYALPRLGGFVPYLAGGGGIQRDDVDTSGIVFLNGYGTSFLSTKKTEFAVNIGAGVSIPVSDRWGYRADFRWYNPKAEWPESWRAYSGVTLGWWGPKQEP